MRIFVLPAYMFHVKRYNRTYRSRSASPELLPGREVRQGHHSGIQRYAGGPRVGLCIIGVWQHKQSSPSAYGQRAAPAISVALLRAVIYRSRSTGSTSSYHSSRSCLPTRLKTSGWRFYRSSRHISHLSPDDPYWRDPLNPVALRAAQLARQARDPR